MDFLWLGEPDCHDPRTVGGKAANLSLLTWPMVLSTALALVYLFFFKFPLILTVILIAGAFFASVLVANFQFYVFKGRCCRSRNTCCRCTPPTGATGRFRR